MGVAAALLAGATILPASHSADAVTRSTGATTYPVRTHQNLVYAKSPAGSALTANVDSPIGDAKTAPVLIIIHGGGFNSGDKQGEAPYAEAMASVGFVTVNVNYTLATKTGAGYPVQVQEIQHAIQWTESYVYKYGGNPRKIALLGFSAGGYLAAEGALYDYNLPGQPIKAVVTLSAPLNLSALDQLLRARVAACGSSPTCPQVPQAPEVSAFAPLFEYLGCPKGSCSANLIRAASPSSHIKNNDPPFLIYNSANELIPRSQATDMGAALHAAGVSEKVVIVPGTQHGEAYLPEVDTDILTYLDKRLGLSQSVLQVSSTQSGSSGALTTLVVCCAVIIAASLSIALLAVRRRTAGRRNGGTSPMGGR
jgi:acetyl esterase/lipase